MELHLKMEATDKNCFLDIHLKKEASHKTCFLDDRITAYYSPLLPLKFRCPENKADGLKNIGIAGWVQ